nr:hypothetical protein [Tanacetum cinerariifolium]
EEAIHESPKATKPTSSQPPKPKLASTKPSKSVLEKKWKLVKETADEPSPAKRSKDGLVGTWHKPKSPLKLVDEFADEVTPVNKEKDASNMELTEINAGVQDEGQAGSNLGKLNEGQAGSNHEFTTTAYPNVQENLKLPTEDQEEETEKTNAESEVQSMVTVLIHQDTSSVPPMTTIVIDLTTSQSESPTAHAPLPTSTATTITITKTTTLPPPPPQLQQSTTYLTLLQCIDLDEAHRKKRKKCDLPRTPSGSLPPQPPPPPPLVGAFGAPGSEALSSSKTAASTTQPMAWTTSDTRYESTGFAATQETSPIDYLMNDDSIPDEQFHLSDDEDTKNDHLPKADNRKDWWKPLPEEERPATPEPAWTIPSSNASDVNLEGDQVRIDVSGPLLLGGPPGHVNIQTIFFFNKDLDHLRYGIKGIRPALSLSRMKADHYPDFGLELLVPEQIHDSLSHRREVRKHMQILNVIRIKAFLRYGYHYLSEIVLRRADFQEQKIVENDFKNLYPSDFEDLNLLLLQGYLDHLSGFDKCFEFKHDYTIIESPRAVVFSVNNNKQKIMRFNEMYNFSDGSSGLRRFFRYAMFIYSFYLRYSLSLYPFTERYAQPYFFHVLYGRLFKTLCLLNYALMIRHDYDITSSLRRGALQSQSALFLYSHI